MARTEYRSSMNNNRSNVSSNRGGYSNRRGADNGNSYGNRNGYSRDEYINDNLARKHDFVRTLEEEPRRSISNEARKNREKARHMSLGYVIFLVAALCCTGVVLVNYLQIQSNVTRAAEVVADKEQELNNLKLSNDETLNRINSSIDVEEIKRIAIGELGMTNASEGQIITYTSEGNDYLRRVAGD